MTFFEHIGKKLSDAGQGMMQQTKNISDITRLNGVISEKEKRITQLYMTIGQSYYERHKNDSNAEDLTSIQETTALLSDVAKCKEEIRQIKGSYQKILKCPNCGNDIPAAAVFCNSCGAKVFCDATESSTDIQNETACPSCGKAVPDGNLFCVWCGAKIDNNLVKGE